VLALIDKQLINSAHDISEGGIIAALAECCIIDEENLLGAEVNIPVKTRKDLSFFSESQSRVIISVSPANKNAVEKVLEEKGQPFIAIGKTGGTALKINDGVSFDLNKLADLYFNTISRIMNA